MNRTAFWIAPGITSVLSLAAYGPFGVVRDFGAFVIGTFFILPALGLLLLILGPWSLLERRAGWKATVRSFFLAALAPALLIPLLWAFGDPLRDPARYAVWATFHRHDLDVARRRDGVFMHWDDWGMAGGGNDSYLASDPADTLSRQGMKEQWAKDHGLGCDLVAVRRMQTGVYVVTTSNCVLAGF